MENSKEAQIGKYMYKKSLDTFFISSFSSSEHKDETILHICNVRRDIVSTIRATVKSVIFQEMYN